jgi:hypothetical protein
MFGKLLIFVSSTSDLADERKALKSLFGRFGGIYDGYFYEDDPARSDAPEDRCREMIESADVFVSILGTKYGSLYPPPGRDGSIVKWELETARSRPDLGLIAVVIKKHSRGEEIDPRQESLIQSVKGWRGLWCREYESATAMPDEVLRSLVQWSGEIVKRTIEEKHGSKQQMRRFLRPLAVASVVGLLLLFALNYWMGLGISTPMLVGASAFECVLLLAILILTL